VALQRAAVTSIPPPYRLSKIHRPDAHQLGECIVLLFSCRRLDRVAVIVDLSLVLGNERRYALGALGRGRFRKRTPGPPPFSEMNWAPPPSSALNLSNGLRPNVSGLMSNPRFELVRHDVCFSLYVEVDKIHNLACPASPIHYQFDPVACEPRKPGRIHDSSAGEDRRTGADARLRLREPSTRGTRYSLSAARLDLSKSNCTSR